ncbi:hypothetical protein KAFR_0A07660 [Kazachstania africana CBS 2517]|uniref:Uncharacterized protein n=1 Tax=Kazachstania africana (strain ATCC 22294 / BCRC 22015 / CBS 2517 / CECT 1963 / NBRC 1671 / NRRL Y-8276) TaxID=1071382 RepID=H2APA0_KAZAF|nr:hypothetical protein KAFR_0A07660 [Kazachstania africana CBS 2517]CCF56200.1 hypothetical protein KAFR_0A07660 [Kazachstania africana CBS 2517]
MKRVKFGKKKNAQAKKKQLVTQDDYYEEAVLNEEQAERWLLSDIKKSLRFYLIAYNLYEVGLTTQEERTESCTYNICYNQTRLLLQIHTDYLANNGYINILRYINLEDIPDIEKILLELPDIISRLENVLSSFSEDNITWDLKFNLLTSYLSMVESSDLTRESVNLIDLCNRFIDLSQNLISSQINELKSWDSSSEGQDSNISTFQRDTLDSDNSVDRTRGTGILTGNNNEGDSSEMMEVSDQVTTDSLSELLTNCYKFSQSVMEFCIENVNSNDATINEVQNNYLVDLITKFLLYLDDVLSSILVEEKIEIKHEDLDIVRFAIEGLKIITVTNRPDELVTYINSASIEGIELNLSKIDLLEFAINQIDDEQKDVQWGLATLLNRILNDTRSRLSLSRNECIKTNSDLLSRMVFQLCDVTITSSDNELRRFAIRKRENSDANTEVLNILMKNAVTLVTNAMNIAEKSCGLQETIVDKLKRNYIFNQARLRSQLLQEITLKGQISISLDSETNVDQLKDHSFYKLFL